MCQAGQKNPHARSPLDPERFYGHQIDMARAPIKNLLEVSVTGLSPFRSGPKTHPQHPQRNLACPTNNPPPFSGLFFRGATLKFNAQKTTPSTLSTGSRPGSELLPTPSPCRPKGGGAGPTGGRFPLDPPFPSGIPPNTG